MNVRLYHLKPAHVIPKLLAVEMRIMKRTESVFGHLCSLGPELESVLTSFPSPMLPCSIRSPFIVQETAKVPSRGGYHGYVFDASDSELPVAIVESCVKKTHGKLHKRLFTCYVCCIMGRCIGASSSRGHENGKQEEYHAVSMASVGDRNSYNLPTPQG